EINRVKPSDSFIKSLTRELQKAESEPSRTFREVEVIHKPKKSRRWITFAASAAAVCLIVTAAVFLRRFDDVGGFITNMGEMNNAGCAPSDYRDVLYDDDSLGESIGNEQNGFGDSDDSVRDSGTLDYNDSQNAPEYGIEFPNGAVSESQKDDELTNYGGMTMDYAMSAAGENTLPESPLPGSPIEVSGSENEEKILFRRFYESEELADLPLHGRIKWILNILLRYMYE
ncbi:MAG: hypothetical protein FWF82_07465, partial [Oscillospiraceae bacterium]|nr:hypothetical protein [Oscillospiraceae bacterium]